MIADSPPLLENLAKSITDLPLEILIDIGTRLSFKHLLKLRFLSQKFKNAIYRIASSHFLDLTSLAQLHSMPTNSSIAAYVNRCNYFCGIHGRVKLLKSPWLLLKLLDPTTSLMSVDFVDTLFIKLELEEVNNGIFNATAYIRLMAVPDIHIQGFRIYAKSKIAITVTSIQKAASVLYKMEPPFVTKTTMNGESLEENYVNYPDENTFLEIFSKQEDKVEFLAEGMVGLCPDEHDPIVREDPFAFSEPPHDIVAHSHRNGSVLIEGSERGEVCICMVGPSEEGESMCSARSRVVSYLKMLSRRWEFVVSCLVK